MQAAKIQLRIGRLEKRLWAQGRLHVGSCCGVQVYRLAPTNMEALRYLAQLSQVGRVAAANSNVLICAATIQ